MSKIIQEVQGVPIYKGSQAIKVERLPSLLKWAGGKEQELRYILPMIPPFDTYYEPFVGGGAVFFSIQSRKKFINDKSPDLFNLYTMIAKQNLDFFQALNTLLLGWQYVSKIVDDCAMHGDLPMTEDRRGRLAETIVPRIRPLSRRVAGGVLGLDPT